MSLLSGQGSKATLGFRVDRGWPVRPLRWQAVAPERLVGPLVGRAAPALNLNRRWMSSV